MELARIRIKNLRLRTYVGFNAGEQHKRQDVVVNLAIGYRADGAAQADDVAQALDYKAITKQIIELVENNRYLLLEKLGRDVLALVLDHEPVRQVEVEVDKPHALRFSDSVSLTLSASRP